MSEREERKKGEMSFIEHLEVLRWHLVRSVAAIIIIAVLAFLNKAILFDHIIFAPKSSDFVTFRLLCNFSSYLATNWPSYISDPDLLCIGQNIPPLQNINLAGQFTTHLMVSVLTGFILGFPYVFYEIWKFIKPGLHEKEARYSGGIIFWASLLFATGVLFGYFVIAPLSVNFFATYSISSEVTTLPTLSTYITTVTTVVLAAAIVFELPLVVYFFAKIGILTPELLKTYRRHFIVVALILSAIITPPDIFSQVLVTIPLIILYEISITIARRVTRVKVDSAVT
jgi:sec-independent protein translocase protein TatC